MNILLTAATQAEIQPLCDWLRAEGEYLDSQSVLLHKLRITVLISGVGSPATAYALGKFFGGKPDIHLAIQAGVAGSYRRDLELGSVLAVTEDRFADIGAEDSDGNFLDLSALGLVNPDSFPYKGGKLIAPNAGAINFLLSASAITVNTVSGTWHSSAGRQARFGADLETMEGAAFALACLSEKIPFLQIRAISNYVESRKRENWQLGPAIRNLNETLTALLQKLL